MLSMPNSSAERFRSCAVALVGVPWRLLDSLKMQMGVLFVSPRTTPDTEKLKQENQLLKQQIERLRDELASYAHVLQEVQKISGFLPEDPFLKRREQEILRRVELHTKSLGARVIFREPASWSSSFWINVGEKNNQALGENVVAKNSPVVLGGSLVGVVEYVGEKRSRVRLITDNHLTLAVRAVRGEEQNRYALELLSQLYRFAEKSKNQKEIGDVIKKLEKSWGGEADSLYLAKGELSGSSEPLWRSRGTSLKGTGFNYDFADEEGPERHLITGEPLNQLGQGKKVSLIKPGDLLITTGLDGLFPPGLRVAYVTEVAPLREGACAYDIRAKSVIPSLEGVSFVTVLPPID